MLSTHILNAISTSGVPDHPACFPNPQRELRAQAVEKRSQPKKPKAPLSNQEFRNPNNDPNMLQVGTVAARARQARPSSVRERRNRALVNSVYSTARRLVSVSFASVYAAK